VNRKLASLVEVAWARKPQIALNRCMKTSFSSGAEIRRVHLEPTSYCNARCPICPRNDHGVADPRVVQHHLSLAEVKQIFSAEFISELELFLCEGNFGDPIMNPQLADILWYFAEANPQLKLEVTTNGGARSETWWQQLAAVPNLTVRFSIDGLEDTNHLYRQDVDWQVLQRNFGAFIAAGGDAQWKFIVFDHNQHQAAQAQQLADAWGFSLFSMENHGRSVGIAFDKDGNLSHTIGDWQGDTDYARVSRILAYDQTDTGKHMPASRRPADSIDCSHINSIYVDSRGFVYPCCFTAFANPDYSVYNPETVQLRKFIRRNNALRHGLAKSIKWFQQLEHSWQQSSVDKGRCSRCENTCGVWKDQSVESTSQVRNHHRIKINLKE